MAPAPIFRFSLLLDTFCGTSCSQIYYTGWGKRKMLGKCTRCTFSARTEVPRVRTNRDKREFAVQILSEINIPRFPSCEVHYLRCRVNPPKKERRGITARAELIQNYCTRDASEGMIDKLRSCSIRTCLRRHKLTSNYNRV
jgi:hypothetical protein